MKWEMRKLCHVVIEGLWINNWDLKRDSVKPWAFRTLETCVVCAKTRRERNQNFKDAPQKFTIHKSPRIRRQKRLKKRVECVQVFSFFHNTNVSRCWTVIYFCSRSARLNVCVFKKKEAKKYHKVTVRVISSQVYAPRRAGTWGGSSRTLKTSSGIHANAWDKERIAVRTYDIFELL